MSDIFAFEGTVVRVEDDGFGVVRFDQPHSANTHGFFSASTMDVELPITVLKPGLHVIGTAESGNTEFAEVKTLQVD